MVVAQMPGGGLRAGVQALPSQVFAQLDDQAHGGIGDGPRGAVRPPRPRLERRLALSTVAGHQPGHPALGRPVSPGHLPLRAALSDNSGEDKTRLRHPPTVPARPFPCPETRRSITARKLWPSH
jgi:hypothetical protein